MLIVGHQNGVETQVVQYDVGENEKDWKLHIKKEEPTAGRHLYLDPGKYADIKFGKHGLIVRATKGEAYRIDLVSEFGSNDIRRSRVEIFKGTEVDQIDFFKTGKRIGYLVGDSLELE